MNELVERHKLRLHNRGFYQRFLLVSHFHAPSRMTQPPAWMAVALAPPCESDWGRAQSRP